MGTAIGLLHAVRCLIEVVSVLLLASGIHSYIDETYTTMTRTTTDCYQGFTYTLCLLSAADKMRVVLRTTYYELRTQASTATKNSRSNSIYDGRDGQPHRLAHGRCHDVTMEHTTTCSTLKVRSSPWLSQWNAPCISRYFLFFVGYTIGYMMEFSMSEDTPRCAPWNVNIIVYTIMLHSSWCADW